MPTCSPRPFLSNRSETRRLRPPGKPALAEMWPRLWDKEATDCYEVRAATLRCCRRQKEPKGTGRRRERQYLRGGDRQRSESTDKGSGSGEPCSGCAPPCPRRFLLEQPWASPHMKPRQLRIHTAGAGHGAGHQGPGSYSLASAKENVPCPSNSGGKHSGQG